MSSPDVPRPHPGYSICNGMKIKMNREEIKQYIPHRDPFLLVDLVEVIEPEKFIRAVKYVTADEPHFKGHFPGRPVMPGVLMIEALAQAGGVLMAKTFDWPANHGNFFVLAGIDDARFKRVVEPGDTLILEVEVLKARRDLWKVLGKASVKGELACSAEIMMARGR